jgi:hypothetical protein
MLMRPGIDLPAKFYAGSDLNGKVRERIRTFAERFIFTGLPSASRF